MSGGRFQPPVVEAVGIVVEFDGRRILDEVALNVGQGEFVGLIGSNGAGKTTLLRVLLGALSPSAGVVRRPSRHGPGGGIGYVPQKLPLEPDVPLRARDVVALGLDGGRLGFPVRSSGRRRQVDAALDAVGAGCFAEQRVGELSGGQQQRVLVAHALISRPALLLLDEPLASLDPASAQDVVELLDRLRADTGVAIVLTAHDMNPLLPVMDRVAYLARGAAVAGIPDEVVTDEVLTRLYRRPIHVVRAEGRVIVLAGSAGSPLVTGALG